MNSIVETLYLTNSNFVNQEIPLPEQTLILSVLSKIGQKSEAVYIMARDLKKLIGVYIIRIKPKGKTIYRVEAMIWSKNKSMKESDWQPIANYKGIESLEKAYKKLIDKMIGKIIGKHQYKFLAWYCSRNDIKNQIIQTKRVINTLQREKIKQIETNKAQIEIELNLKSTTKELVNMLED